MARRTTLVYMGTVCFQPGTCIALSTGGWTAHQSRRLAIGTAKQTRRALPILLPGHLSLVCTVGLGSRARHLDRLLSFRLPVEPRSTLFWVFYIGSRGRQ